MKDELINPGYWWLLGGLVGAVLVEALLRPSMSCGLQDSPWGIVNALIAAALLVGAWKAGETIDGAFPILLYGMAGSFPAAWYFLPSHASYVAIAFGAPFNPYAYLAQFVGCVLLVGVACALTARARRLLPIKVRRPPAGRCACCGYLLYGLPEPRCPECGEAFDPAEVHSKESEAPER